MSEYGIKIKNIEASTLYEYNNGVRDHYEYKDAMFTNSLFSDFLKENGLKVWKEESTRDLICLEFNFGSRSYDEEILHLQKVARDARTEYKLAKSHGYNSQIQKKRNKRKKLSQLFQEANKNKDKYHKHTKEEIRTLFNALKNTAWIENNVDKAVQRIDIDQLVQEISNNYKYYIGKDVWIKKNF